jgi:hypothetical protein
VSMITGVLACTQGAQYQSRRGPAASRRGRSPRSRFPAPGAGLHAIARQVHGVPLFRQAAVQIIRGFSSSSIIRTRMTPPQSGSPAPAWAEALVKCL